MSLFTFLIKPIEAVIVAFKLATMGKERNAIHSGLFPRGIKKASFSSDYDVALLEKVALEKGMTPNQLIMAVFG